MSLTSIIALLATLAAGGMLAVQASVNASLSQTLGDPFLTSAVSFAIGLLALAGMVTLRQAWPTSLAGLGALPWWSWTGGLLGACYMAIVVWGVPRLGVLSAVGALVLGQVVAAMLIDSVGAFGLPIREISMQRVGAAGLILLGLILSRAGT